LVVLRSTESVDRVALVTGADRNLGRAMALSLLDAGLSVVLTALSKADLDAAVQEAGLSASRALTITADISREADRRMIVSESIARFGRVDVLVNNAAVTPETYWPDWLVTGEPKQWTLEPDFYRHFLEVDSIAPHAFVAAFVPAMIERGWGRVVNVTTSLDTMLRFWPYGSAKAALEAQTASLATQLAGTGVTANVLIPGGFSKPAELHLSGGHVVRPQFTPEIMAAPIRWLASGESNECSGKRILASRWNDQVGEPNSSAIFPVAWTGYGEGAANPAILGA
jgi:3-oxoacyl-[acyl-carrier protein] reductase